MLNSSELLIIFDVDNALLCLFHLDLELLGNFVLGAIQHFLALRMRTIWFQSLVQILFHQVDHPVVYLLFVGLAYLLSNCALELHRIPFDSFEAVLESNTPLLVIV
jgi:hypothetical protein